MSHDTITRLVIPVIESATGFRPKPVLCDEGYLVYGFGFRTDENQEALSAATLPISRPDALARAQNHITHLIYSIEAALYNKATVNQMVAMVDYAYDMGWDKFLGTSIINLMNNDHFERARKAMMSGVYIKKNGCLQLSKAKESRRRMACKSWDSSPRLQEQATWTRPLSLTV